MKKFLKIVGTIIGAIVVLAVVIAGIALALGYAYGGVKQPHNVVSIQTEVCSNKDIDAYNKLVTVYPMNEEQQTKKAADFKALADDFKSKANYLKDPSCVFMVYGAAVQNRDQDGAKLHYNTLVSLFDAANYPKNTILDIASLQSMKDRVESLQNPDEVEQNPLGSG